MSSYANNNPGIPNNNPNSNTTANSSKMYALYGSTPQTGLGITLKVMAGDRIDIAGLSFWKDNNYSGNSNSIPLNDILTGLLGSPTGVTAGKGATLATLTATNGTVIPTSFLTRTPAQGDLTPNAYINYIFFDEQFKYAGGGFSKVNSSNSTYSAKQHYSELQNIAVPKNGYVYVYVSNQSPVTVYFDNLQVVHTKGALLEETHYYPFGLTMSGISSQAAGSLENKRKFNKGSELQSKEFSDGSGLEMYDTHFRQLDPQLGRWWQIDPKPNYAESPYSAMGNNPILNNDPLGDTIEAKGTFFQRLKINAKLTIASVFSSHAREMIRDLKKSPFKVIIEFGSKAPGTSVTSYNNLEDAGKKGTFWVDIMGKSAPTEGTGKGTGSHIVLTRNKASTKSQDINGEMSGNKTTSVLHELFHAWQASYGKQDFTVVDGLRNSERDAVNWDNVIRTELGKTPRASYQTETLEVRDVYNEDFKDRAEKADPSKN